MILEADPISPVTHAAPPRCGRPNCPVCEAEREAWLVLRRAMMAAKVPTWKN